MYRKASWQARAPHAKQREHQLLSCPSSSELSAQECLQPTGLLAARKHALGADWRRWACFRACATGLGDILELRDQSLERGQESLPRSEAQWGAVGKRSPPSPWGHSFNHTTEEGCGRQPISFHSLFFSKSSAHSGQLLLLGPRSCI